MKLSQQPDLSTLYDSLWGEALHQFTRSGVEVDPYLPHTERDGRRGLTLLARPSSQVSDIIGHFCRSVAPVLLDQYFYPAASLHLTVLSLFTATENFASYDEQLTDYRRVVRQVVQQAEPFVLTFRGITASPGSVMIQGFPQGDALHQMREALRAGLTSAGLTRGLDTRYRLVTAHITVLRFQRQPADLSALEAALESFRQYDFGKMVVERLELVKSDWYLSPDKVDIVAAYPLPRR